MDMINLNDNQSYIDQLFENLPALCSLDREEMITIALMFAVRPENLNTLIEHYKEEDLQ